MQPVACTAAVLLAMCLGGVVAEMSGCLRVTMRNEDHFMDVCDSNKKVDLLWQGNMGEVCSPENEDRSSRRETKHYFLLYTMENFDGRYKLVNHGDCENIRRWQRIKSVLHCTLEKSRFGDREGRWNCDTDPIREESNFRDIVRYIPASLDDATNERGSRERRWLSEDEETISTTTLDPSVANDDLMEPTASH